MEAHSHTVLVVDNDPLDRSTICAGLKGRGYTCIEANDGQQAMEILRRQQSIDTVLVDLVLPGMDGFKVLSEIKADSALRNIPVIVVSAADDMESVLRSIEMGAVVHLSKPVEMEVLDSQVKAALASKRSDSAEQDIEQKEEGEEEEEEDDEEGGSLAEFGRHMLVLTGPYWKWTQIPLVLLVMLVSIGFASALPLGISFITDYGLIPHDLKLLIVILVVMLVVAIGSTALSVVGDYLYARVGTKVVNDLRFNMYRHVQQLSMGYFKRTPIGDTMSRFSADVASVDSTIMLSVPTIFGQLVSMVSTLALLFYLEWRLALFALVGLYLSYKVGEWMEPKASGASYRTKVQQGKIQALLQEDLQGQSVVKVFRLQGMLTERFKRLMINYYGAARRATFLGYMVEEASSQSLLLFNMLVFAAGCFLTYGGYLTVGQLVSFQLLLSALNAAVAELTWGLPHLIQASAGMQRIRELLDESPEVTDVRDAVAIPRISREIALDGVKFGYGEDKLNLDDVSMIIPSDSTAAFVGPSGCGKSTVLNLLMRFYDPGEGSVAVDGTDIRGITQNSLRSNISVVLQDNYLFNISIRENIRMGCRDASDAAVEEAAKVADIHDIIQAMPEGYDTLVGEGGGKLSGGQRQRVAIARAIIADPAILLLDEATSALDPATASSINEALERISKGRTVISVTHRLQSAAEADRVFVFQEGHLVEQGRHEELLQEDGLYALLWGKQSGFSIDQQGAAKVEWERLRDIFLFKNLDDTALKRMSYLFTTEHYAPDRVVIQEGDADDRRFYVIVRGQVEVSRRLSDGASEKLEVLEDGDYFGEIALLKKVPRVATFRTLSDCTLLCLADEHFQWVLEDAPGLLEELETALEEVLRSPKYEWAAQLLGPPKK